jgi:predicted tellurium resistance membrane protein TerC
VRMLFPLTQPDSWIALGTLSILEVVLGIDNLIVLSILVTVAPPAQRRRVRVAGVFLALLARLALLFSIVWLTGLQAPLFAVLGRGISPRELILGAGGAVLVFQSIAEIRRALGAFVAPQRSGSRRGFLALVLQIVLLDVVFSLDSVFTAVGLARPDQVLIMATAIVIAALAMLWVSGPIASLIARYPSIKILALASVVLIGASLMGQALGFDWPKAYLYCAIGFALAVQLLNMRRR